jgi:hypothetical protein
MPKFFRQLYRTGNIVDFFISREIRHSLLANKNYYSIMEELNIINAIIRNLRDHIEDLIKLASNKADGAVNQVIPNLSLVTDRGLVKYELINSLSSNTNDIAVRTIIAYSRQGFLTGLDTEIDFLANNSNQLAVDYVFEILNNPNINYNAHSEYFWDNISSNSNDRAVDYIFLNIIGVINHDIIDMNFETINILIGNKNQRLMDYLRVNFFNIPDVRNNIINHINRGLDLSVLFKNKKIFEIDTQDRIDKNRQIQMIIKNINFKLNN